MKPSERIQLGISLAIRISLIGAAILSLVEGRWMTLFIATTVFILTFIPALIEKNFKVFLPLEFEFITILFIYATLYLGEVQSFYLKYWWWDVLLHGVSALVFGLIGFLIVYVLTHEPDLNVDMSPGFVFLFSFAFAVMIGTIWEIFEFGMDQFFGMNMQKTGLVDTMWDLIIDSIGALIASLAGYLYLKTGESNWFGNLVEEFVDKNPDIFDQ